LRTKREEERGSPSRQSLIVGTKNFITVDYGHKEGGGRKNLHQSCEEEGKSKTLHRVKVILAV